jgi:ribosomal protein S18 acetylase RimI-like enzyme
VTSTVRRFESADFDLLRAMRLRALATAPSAFGSTYERESAFTDDEWQHRLRPDGYAHFGCFDERGQAVGLVVGGPDEDGEGTCHLYAMWVEPEARGTDVADALVAAVVAWATERGCPQLQLLVTEGNDRAERMYRRNGFELTGRSQMRDRDSVRELEMMRDLGTAVT